MGPNHSPIQSSFPSPSPLPSNIPFTQAKSTIFSIPAEDGGKYDVYINDTITIAPDLPGNASRIAAAILLVIHTFCCPLSTQEPTPQSHTISTSKLTAEGTIDEVKVILGCKYDTRSLVISLPDQKYFAWSHNLEQLLHKDTTSHNELDTIIGRLNHVAYVIPTAKYFLSRIRHFKSS